MSGTGTGNPTGVAYTAGGNISYNGWTIRISGVPAAGDTFTVGPNTSGIADGRNAEDTDRLGVAVFTTTEAAVIQRWDVHPRPAS